MTRKPFVVRVDVSGDFWRQDPESARAFANGALHRAASHRLRGPRGGTYLPVGEPYKFRDEPDDFFRDRHVFVCRVDAKYVRPSRLVGEPAPDTEVRK